MSIAWTVLVPLAQKVPDPADVKPGWLGLGVVFALGVAVVLLWLSMRRHLKKVDFEEDPEAGGGGARPADGPADTSYWRRGRSRRAGGIATSGFSGAVGLTASVGWVGWSPG